MKIGLSIYSSSLIFISLFSLCNKGIQTQAAMRSRQVVKPSTVSLLSKFVRGESSFIKVEPNGALKLKFVKNSMRGATDSYPLKSNSFVFTKSLNTRYDDTKIYDNAIKNPDNSTEYNIDLIPNSQVIINTRTKLGLNKKLTFTNNDGYLNILSEKDNANHSKTTKLHRLNLLNKDEFIEINKTLTTRQSSFVSKVSYDGKQNGAIFMSIKENTPLGMKKIYQDHAIEIVDHMYNGGYSLSTIHNKRTGEKSFKYTTADKVKFYYASDDYGNENSELFYSTGGLRRSLEYDSKSRFLTEKIFDTKGDVLAKSKYIENTDGTSTEAILDYKYKQQVILVRDNDENIISERFADLRDLT